MWTCLSLSLSLFANNWPMAIGNGLPKITMGWWWISILTLLNYSLSHQSFCVAANKYCNILLFIVRLYWFYCRFDCSAIYFYWMFASATTFYFDFASRPETREHFLHFLLWSNSWEPTPSESCLHGFLACFNNWICRMQLQYICIGLRSHMRFNMLNCKVSQ